MHTLRTRFKRDIVAEFLPPRRPRQGGARSRTHKSKDKVIILCSGMPGVPCQKHILEFFSKRGYWVFSPRYRGMWESGGWMLQKSPHEDVRDVIHDLYKPIRSLEDGKVFRINPSAIYLLASSFGGPAAILNSADSRVTKVIAFSPVIDWRAMGRSEPIEKLRKYLREGFGPAYRFKDKDLLKLKNGKFYNPAAQSKIIDGKKVFIIHAKNDTTVPYRPSVHFAKATGSKLLLMKRGEHFSLSDFIRPRFYKNIKLFLANK